MQKRLGQALGTQPNLTGSSKSKRAYPAEAADQNSDNDKHNSPQEITLEQLYYAEYDKDYSK
jgi:hypothetical protein